MTTYRDKLGRRIQIRAAMTGWCAYLTYAGCRAEWRRWNFDLTFHRNRGEAQRRLDTLAATSGSGLEWDSGE
jgi:hypothetical protein